MFRKHRCWMETSIWRTGPQKGIKWKGKILDCHKFAFIPSELGLKEIYSGPHLSKLFRGIHIWRNVSVVFLQNKIEKVEKRTGFAEWKDKKCFYPSILHICSLAGEKNVRVVSMCDVLKMQILFHIKSIPALSLSKTLQILQRLNVSVIRPCNTRKSV